VTSTRKLGVAQPTAWAEAARYFAWDPQPVDEALLRATREVETRHKLSWWDSMIVAAAQLQQCAVLLTEDLQDGAVFGPVTARSPFTLDVKEERAEYSVERPKAVVPAQAGTPFAEKNWIPAFAGMTSGYSVRRAGAGSARA
jgi:hypothetical protein